MTAMRSFAGISFFVAPISYHVFCQQTAFKRQLGNDFFQHSGTRPQFLDFGGCRLIQSWIVAAQGSPTNRRRSIRLTCLRQRRNGHNAKEVDVWRRNTYASAVWPGEAIVVFVRKPHLLAALSIKKRSFYLCKSREIYVDSTARRLAGACD